MRKGFIVLITFVLLFTLTGFPFAEEESGNVERSAKSREGHKEDKGLCFSVSGLSSVGIGQYEGGIGGKYWISKKLAMVSSIGIKASKITRTSNYQDYSDWQETSNFISFIIGLEDHFFIRNKISPYWGGGLRFSIGNSDVDYSLPKVNPLPTAVKKTESSSNSFGIRGFCGIEIFITDWVSLSGQYQIDYSTGSSTTKTILFGGEGVTNPKDIKSTTKTLGMGTSSLVATFYMW